uniref:Uncharacterized protein n=1 Tax=mine drainage metagenome TaxID=410659 RepID=E6PXV4_9ZZZZ
MKRVKTLKNRPSGSKIVIFVAVLVVGINGTAFYFMFRRPKPDAVPVPHFFASLLDAKPLPQTLDPKQFSNRYVVAAYQAAKQIPEVLARQPCYCHCDRSRGHRSLLDCFASHHGSDCDICVKEALFVSQEQRKGKSPEQIRSEIIQGGWRTIQVQ